MTFVLVLQDDSGYCEELNDRREDARNVVIGYDDESDHLYTFFVSFYGENPREIAFCIFEYDGELHKIRTIQNALEVSKLISREDRIEIKAHLMSCLRDMIERCNPKAMFMCSVDTPLVSAAEVKYSDIVAIASRLGYRDELTELGNGQKFWWMERETDSKVGNE